MKREILFRRVHFFDEEQTKFSHFTFWGIDIGLASFTSPSTNNYALYHKDEQFTGLTDKDGKKIFEGDKLCDAIDTCIVVWNNASWQIKYSYEEYPQEIDLHYTTYEVIGNIYE